MFWCNNCKGFILSSIALGLGLWFNLGLAVQASPYHNPLQAAPDEQTKPYQQFYIDINNDEKPESVALIAYNHSENGYLAQLVFFDENGQFIWEGPRARYASGQAFLP